jgi:hypothetical protein
MASITDIIGDFTNPTEKAHKQVCIKAGTIPGITYSIAFCKYLKSNTKSNPDGSCDWCIVSGEGEYKIQGESLKSYKKAWIKERAGAKADEAEKNMNMDSAEAQKEIAAADKAIADAKSNEDKLAKLQDKLDSINSQISKLNSSKASYEKKANRAGQPADTRSIEAQLKQLQSDKQKTESEIAETKKKIEQEIATAKQQKKDAEEKNKGNKWWYKKLKEWKQAKLDEEQQKEGKDKQTVLDIVTTEDLILLATVANNENTGSNGTHKWTEYDTNPDLAGDLDTKCKSIWSRQPTICSIKNDLDPKLLEEAESLVPDTSGAFLTDAISNTFAAAKTAKNLLNIEQQKQQVKFLAGVTAAAAGKLTSRVVAQLSDSIVQITDLTPITTIPMDAAAAMASKIMTPAQLIQKIQEGMNDDTVKNQQTKELEESMAEMENKITEVKQELNYLYGDKIKKFNDEISKITNTINQGPDWYIDQVNRIEMKYEKEATKAIQDVTANILDKKFMFRDAMVDAVSYNLVIPVNKELEKVQLEIVRKVVELAKLAIITAKALAQKAILKLLALFGA